MNPFQDRNSCPPPEGLYDELIGQADALIDLEQFDQAEICYRQAAVVSPDRPEPFVALGVLAMQQEHYPQAVSAFQTARSIDDDCDDAYAGLAMAHQQQQHYGRAFEMYLHSLERNPDNLLALLGLFQTSCQMGTFAKIIHYLQQYLEKHPEDHSVLFCLATLYAREGMLLQAKEALLTVLASDAEKTEARQLLDDVQRRLKHQTISEVA